MRVEVDGELRREDELEDEVGSVQVEGNLPDQRGFQANVFGDDCLVHYDCSRCNHGNLYDTCHYETGWRSGVPSRRDTSEPPVELVLRPSSRS